MNLNYRQIRKQFSDIGLAYFMFSAAAMAAQFLAVLLFRLMGWDNLLGTTGSVLLSMGGMYLVGFPVYLFFIRRVPVQPEPEGGREAFPLSRAVVCLVVSIGVMQAGNLFSRVLLALVSALLDRELFNPVDDILGQENLVVMVLFTAVVAPVFEEIMFRKLLIDRIRNYGDRAVILVSGITFGLFHGNFYQFFYAWGLGMILAYVYLRTGKVKHTILLHMCINIQGSVISTLLLQLSSYTWVADVLVMVYSLLIFSVAVAGAVLAVCLWKRRKFLRGPEELPAARIFPTAFGNVGMALFLGACLWQFWINMK